MAIRSKDLTGLPADARDEVVRQMDVPHGMARCSYCTKPIGKTGMAMHESRCKSNCVTITLPLPPKSLSPNWRGHWRVKAKAVKDYRFLSAYRTEVALYPARRPLWPAATLQATFYHAQKRRRDPDNLNASLKSAQDGLVDAGLLVDDEHVTHLPTKKLIDRDCPRVVLTITKA